MSKTTMAWKVVGSVVVIVHSEEDPSDADWNSSLEALRSVSTQDRPGVLVFTAGGSPTAPQRASSNKAVGALRLRIAVMTGSVIARTVGKALRWFQPQLQIFGPDDVEAALDHIRAIGYTRSAARAALSELKQSLETGT
jgi:hypothetical protein